MIEARTPVFDIGDTLLPDDRLMNEAVEQVLMEQGYSQEDVPKFPIYSYNIFKLQEVQDFLMSNNLKANPAEIVEAYKKNAREFFAASDIPEVLIRCNSEIGTIGFISDNSVEEKEFIEEVLRQHYIDYEGYVVSETVGHEKPSQEIFRAFLDIRDERGENFAYFGNNARVDQGCEKVGMEFVWVKQFNTFGSSWDGKKIEELSFENVKEQVMEEKHEHTHR